MGAAPCLSRLPSEQSAVTVFAAESPHNVLVHAASAPERLLLRFADTMASLGSFSPGRSVIVLAPEHAAAPRRERAGRAHVPRPGSTSTRGGPSLISSAPARSSPVPDEPGHAGVALPATRPAASPAAARRARHSRAGLPGDDAIPVHRGRGPEDIVLCVGGGAAGGHCAFFPSWSRGRSVPFITKEVPYDTHPRPDPLAR